MNPLSLQSYDECVHALWMVEQAIARIQTQLFYAEADKQELGKYKDPQWVLAAKAALRMDEAKKRAIINMRDGFQNKWELKIAALQKEFGAEKVQAVLESV